MKSLSLVSSGLEYIQSLSNGVCVQRDVCSLGSFPFCRGRTFSPREQLLCVYPAVLSGDRFRDVETVVSRTLAVQCAVGVFVQPHLPAERDHQTPGCHCPVMVSHLPEDVNLAVVTCLY